MSELRTANAVGGKTARACDSCVRRRARWYCAADDAFLCQACDASVHLANLLARRHDRVRLKTSSSSPPSRLLPESLDLDSSFPTWNLQGFKRKARTPRRHSKPNSAAADMLAKPAPLVPDLENNNTTNYGGDDENEDAVAAAEEEELLYQVPIFDPDLAGFCCSPPGFDVGAHVEEEKPAPSQLGAVAIENHHQDGDDLIMIGPDGVNPTDAELAEFAADVENLLGEGLLEDHDSCMERLGLMVESRDDGDHNFCRGHVKMELLDGAAVHTSTCGLMGGENGNYLMDDMEYSRDQSPLDFNFDSCGSLEGGEEAQYHKREPVDYHGYGPRNRVGLRLDYEAVISAWSSLRGCSPWTDGERPPSNLDDCWPDFLGMWGGAAGVEGGYGEQGLVGGGQVGITGDGGREARVSRYREKRRTRLFSKKIRYEVRKLNAEKRPRMKGRFVKRAPPFPPPPVAAASAGVSAAAAAAAFPYV